MLLRRGGEAVLRPGPDRGQDQGAVCLDGRAAREQAQQGRGVEIHRQVL